MPSFRSIATIAAVALATVIAYERVRGAGGIVQAAKPRRAA